MNHRTPARLAHSLIAAAAVAAAIASTQSPDTAAAVLPAAMGVAGLGGLTLLAIRVVPPPTAAMHQRSRRLNASDVVAPPRPSLTAAPQRRALAAPPQSGPLALPAAPVAARPAPR